jgi:hypothetical protein
MNEYSIHRLEENEFELLIPLMKNCFGISVKIDYFRWKFIENPAGFVFGFYAKHESGEIAAYYGVIPEYFEIDGKKRIVFQSCDTMTHSNHRRKGLFQLLALHCYNKLEENNLSFIYGFGGGQSTPGFLKFGWIELFKMKYLFYPRSLNVFKIPRKYISAFEITEINKIQHLIQVSNSKSTIHSVKNIETFTWRISNPLYQYRIVVSKTKDYVDSYIVFYELNDKFFIFDFYSENHENLGNLFKYIKSKLEKKHKGIISFTQENSYWSYQLKSNGFLSNPLKIGPLSERIPFIIYDPLKGIEKLHHTTNWLINPFDHDAL